MRVIFRSEDKRWQAQMQREATLIHQETLNLFNESEDEDAEPRSDETLLEEILQNEHEELMALLATMEESQMADMVMRG